MLFTGLFPPSSCHRSPVKAETVATHQLCGLHTPTPPVTPVLGLSPVSVPGGGVGPADQIQLEFVKVMVWGLSLPQSVHAMERKARKDREAKGPTGEGKGKLKDSRHSPVWRVPLPRGKASALWMFHVILRCIQVHLTSVPSPFFLSSFTH